MKTPTPTDTLTPANKQKLLQFRQSILKLFDGFLADCKTYVEVLDDQPYATRKFMLDGGTSIQMLDLLENVGRGKLSPKLLMDTSIGAERLRTVSSVQEQERLLTTGVSIAYYDDGEIKTKIKPIQDLTKTEAPLAICHSGNVPIKSQIEKLKALVFSHNFKFLPYELDGDLLRVRANVKIPFDELERLYLLAQKNHKNGIRMLEGTIKRRQISRVS